MSSQREYAVAINCLKTARACASISASDPLRKIDVSIFAGEALVRSDNDNKAQMRTIMETQKQET